MRVPSSDCALIANLSGAFGEDNAIEYRLHTRLREATEQLSRRYQHKAYTALRAYPTNVEIRARISIKLKQNKKKTKWQVGLRD